MTAFRSRSEKQHFLRFQVFYVAKATFCTRNIRKMYTALMNKKEILRVLNRKRKELDVLSSKIASAAALKAEGTLVSRRVRGATRLYRRISSSKEKYLAPEDKETISILATKTYGQKLYRAAELERLQIEKCIGILESKTDGNVDSADIDQVYGRLPGFIKDNANPSVFTDDGFARRWQEEEYNNRWMSRKDHAYETPRGEKVRSKSEWIIASMLHEAGVPYRYEETVALNEVFQVFLYPDFTVLNKRTRKVYYWEHFGRMDDPEYITNSFMPKMSDYYNFEFLPGDKLLMTFESKGHPLDTTEVKRIIDGFLK